jgi:hypothetical protein
MVNSWRVFFFKNLLPFVRHKVTDPDNTILAFVLIDAPVFKQTTENYIRLFTCDVAKESEFLICHPVKVREKIFWIGIYFCFFGLWNKFENDLFELFVTLVTPYHVPVIFLVAEEKRGKCRYVQLFGQHQVLGK